MVPLQASESSITEDDNVKNRTFSIWLLNQLSFSLPAIDMQHLWLVHILVNMQNALEKKLPFSDFLVFFDRALQFTEAHFLHEETLLTKMGYPDLDNHREEHRRFVNHLLKIREVSNSMNYEQCHKLYRLLRGWLFGHIAKEDKAYARFFEHRNLKAKAIAECAVDEDAFESEPGKLYRELLQNFPEQGQDSDLIKKTSQIVKENNLITGVPLMDLQHFWLIKLIIEMESVSETREEERKEKLMNALAACQLYIREHFRAEEMLVQQLDPESYAGHKSRHIGFHEMVALRKKEAESGNIRAAWALLRNLKEWLYSHIVLEDMHYARICRGNPQKAAQVARQAMNTSNTVPQKKQLDFYRAVLRNYNSK